VRRLLPALLVACASAQHPAPPPTFPQFAPFRLPHTFEPTRYRARLAFHPWWFSGHIEIDGTLSQPSDLIWLHGVDLDVHAATAIHGATRIRLAASPPRDDQTIALVARAPLPAGPWTLELDYSGPIRDHESKPIETRGFYVNRDPPEYRALGLFRRGDFLFTQSEPIYARRIFPCIDEPDRKVPWQLTLDVPSGDIAASNAPIARETPLDAARKRVEFAPTLPLPSYLIAFAIGPFRVTDAGRVHVLARPGTTVPTIDASGLLEKLEVYTGLPYPYPKLDLVAVPQLGLGAMENPGLITIDEHSLASTTTIAHELAHQWFGDLATPRWWNDIWLNESFATWMANKLVPEGDLRTLPSWTREQPVRTPAGDLDQLSIDKFSPFERIEKGAAILATIEQFEGDEAFRTAVQRYLARHAHGSVTTEDLAAELTRMDAAIAPTFAALLDHPFPVLEGHLECGKLVLARPLPWPMPVCIAYDRDGHRAEICAASTPTTTEIALPATACPSWAMPDPRGAALHDTIWEPFLAGLAEHGWSQLSITEQHTVFNALRGDDERFRLISKLDGAPTELLPFLSSSIRYVPDDLRESLRQWVRDHYGARTDTIHLDGDSDSRLAVLLVLAGDPRVTAEAVNIARPYRTGDLGNRVQNALSLAAHDPSFASQLLADTAAETRLNHRYALLDGLRGADLGALFQREPARAAPLTVGERIDLLRYACTQTARTELAKLTSEGRQFVYIDQCLAEKQRLEPAFRAWLEPIKAKLRK